MTDHATERTCAMSRVKAEKGELLRLVLSPEGTPVVDVVGRAPGRGIYVQPELLPEALSKKGVGRVFRGKAQPLPPAEIERQVAEVAERLNQRILELVGLARRAGQLELGTDAVLAGLAGPFSSAVVLLAKDVSEGTAKRIMKALGMSAALVRASTKQGLGRLFGREEVGVVLIHPSKLASRVLAESVRLGGLEKVRAQD